MEHRSKMKSLCQLFIFLIIFFSTFEFASFVVCRFALLPFCTTPMYFDSSGLKWRNEIHLWGVWHKPNSISRHAKECFDVTYTSNDLGARSNINYSTLVSFNNVVVLGDSFVEGWGLDLEDTFTHRLKSVYGKLGLNFGAGHNFGPVQSYIIYKELASKIPHNEVMYFFLPENDFTDNSYEYESSFDNRYRPYFRRSSFGGFTHYYPEHSTKKENVHNPIKLFIQNYTWSSSTLATFKHCIWRNFRGKSHLTLSKTEAGYSIENRNSIEGSIYYLDKMFDTIPSNYKKTLFVIPSQSDIKWILKNGCIYQDYYWYRMLKNVATKHKVLFIDLALDFNNNCSFDYLNEGLPKWFLWCDGHWNKEGNTMALNKLIFHQLE